MIAAAPAGYLPSFWLKLRNTISAPAVNSTVLHNWPVSGPSSFFLVSASGQLSPALLLA